MMKGFTLIELMATIAIFSITASFSIPFFSHFSQKQKVSSDIITTISMINMTRSEAIKNKQTVSLCGLSNDTRCQKNWQQLAIFVNNKSNPIRKVKLSNSYSSIKWSAFQRKPELSFSPNGYTSHLNGSLYLCHKTYPDLHRALKVSKSGRITVSKNKTVLTEKCN